MMRPVATLLGCIVLLLSALGLDLMHGLDGMTLTDMVTALWQQVPDSYEQSILLSQRLPRVLMALHAGSILAVAGCVLQGLVHNPLASPSSLGIHAGAMLAVVVATLGFDLESGGQTGAALAGAPLGMLATLWLARFANRDADARGLALILSGALVSMLFIGIGNALLLQDPARRNELLGWIMGNINHVHLDRLQATWWLGGLCLLGLWALGRPLTLVMLGAERAAAAGVNVAWVSGMAMLLVMLACGAAVAVTGPLGFIGLAVPHMLRPMVGASLRWLIPCAAVLGASLCLLADFLARTLFSPHVIHTGLLLDALGGIVFMMIVRRHYLSAEVQT